MYHILYLDRCFQKHTNLSIGYSLVFILLRYKVETLVMSHDRPYPLFFGHCISMIHTLPVATLGWIGWIIIKAVAIGLTIGSVQHVVHIHTVGAGVNVAVIII